MPHSRPRQHRNNKRAVIVVRLPAVRPVDLDRVEKRLKLRLPAYYRRFLMNYPSKLIETKVDLGWCHESLSDRKLRLNVDELIYYNEAVRKPGTPWTEDEGPWPHRYFVIGDDQCGNYWVIDLSAMEQSVLFYDHDTGKFQRMHKTIREFANELVRATKKWNRENSLRRTSSCS